MLIFCISRLSISETPQNETLVRMLQPIPAPTPKTPSLLSTLPYKPKTKYSSWLRLRMGSVEGMLDETRTSPLGVILHTILFYNHGLVAFHGVFSWLTFGMTLVVI
jgi:hypothetical protein